MYNKTQNAYKYCPEGFILFLYIYLFFVLLNKQSLSHQFIAATKRTRRGGRCLLCSVYFIVFIPRDNIFKGVKK